MIEQRTPEWYAARCGVITGSNAWKIMSIKRDGEPGAERQTYMIQLLSERMTGSVADNFTTKDMQRGIDLETHAIMEYESDTGSIVIGGYWVDAVFWGCTPDGFIDDNGILSVKCPRTTTVVRQRFFETEIPKDYYWQAIAEMAATGRKWVYLMVYDDRFSRRQDQVWIRRIERDNEAVSRLNEEFSRFSSELDSICDRIELSHRRVRKDHQRAISLAEAELRGIEDYLRA